MSDTLFHLRGLDFTDSTLAVRAIEDLRNGSSKLTFSDGQQADMLVPASKVALFAQKLRDNGLSAQVFDFKSLQGTLQKTDVDSYIRYLRGDPLPAYAP